MRLDLAAIRQRNEAFEQHRATGNTDLQYLVASESAEDVPALLAEIRSLRGTAAFIARGLLQIAEQAMPDTYYNTDLRCQAARETLAALHGDDE